MEDKDWIEFVGNNLKKVSETLPENYSKVIAIIKSPVDEWVEVIGYNNGFELPGRWKTNFVTHWMYTDCKDLLGANNQSIKKICEKIQINFYIKFGSIDFYLYIYIIRNTNTMKTQQDINNEKAVANWILKTPTEIKAIRVDNLESPEKTSLECHLCGRPSKSGDHYSCLKDQFGI